MSSEHKPSPGPYETTCGPTSDDWAVCMEDGGDVLAEVTNETGHGEANANLFAAAPDLALYRDYIERSMDRMADHSGWIPVCFEEYRTSEEAENDRRGEADNTGGSRSVCENCGAPADYHSEVILCTACLKASE